MDFIHKDQSSQHLNIPYNCFRFLRRSFSAQAFITCSRKGNWRGTHKTDKNGLVQGHAYTITGIFRVELKQGSNGRPPKKVHLIRVRNPWGDNNEWRGPE